MIKIVEKKNGETVYENVKQVLDLARNNLCKIINFVMVEAYWNIGKLIVEEEQQGKKRAEYGKTLIKELSKKLTKEYGKGFNKRNLWHMKNFFNKFPKVNALRSELSWTHYRILIKVKGKLAREFYLNESAESNWSTRELER